MPDEEGGSSLSSGEQKWVRYHLAIVPIGTVVATTSLLLSTGSKWQWWGSQTDLVLAGQVAPFGAVVYGTAMFLLERIGRMFWALLQRDKDIEKGRKEGLSEGIQRGQQQVLDQLAKLGYLVVPAGNVQEVADTRFATPPDQPSPVAHGLVFELSSGKKVRAFVRVSDGTVQIVALDSPDARQD